MGTALLTRATDFPTDRVDTRQNSRVASRLTNGLIGDISQLLNYSFHYGQLCDRYGPGREIIPFEYWVH